MLKPAPMDLQPGTIHPTNASGMLRVLSYITFDKIHIEFIDTNYRKYVSGKELRKGAIKDPLCISVYGVGYIGDGSFRPSFNGKHSDAYRRWSSMLARCYSAKYQKKFPSYKGCTVCNEWHDFQVFAEWYEANKPSGNEDFHLDKDDLIAGNKVYSPSTATFLSPRENMSLAGKRSAKPYAFLSPGGVLFSGVSISFFSQKNGLDKSAMLRVLSGAASHHKGWKKAPPSDSDKKGVRYGQG
uniref:hypothetical protein n=1 Tax=Rheinheimera sp. TaxID=1869214 RepID=UPI0040480E0A